MSQATREAGEEPNSQTPDQATPDGSWPDDGVEWAYKIVGSGQCGVTYTTNPVEAAIRIAQGNRTVTIVTAWGGDGA